MINISSKYVIKKKNNILNTKQSINIYVYRMIDSWNIILALFNRVIKKVWLSTKSKTTLINFTRLRG